MARYLTNNVVEHSQDLRDLSKDYYYQPGEFWLVWKDGNALPPEGYREATEEEFRAAYDDPNRVTHVLQST
jgi:hypothetical protein